MQLNYHVLGQRIQKIRKRKHISQAALSAMIDKSSGYISYLERGTKVGSWQLPQKSQTRRLKSFSQIAVHTKLMSF